MIQLNLVMSMLAAIIQRNSPQATPIDVQSFSQEARNSNDRLNSFGNTAAPNQINPNFYTPSVGLAPPMQNQISQQTMFNPQLHDSQQIFMNSSYRRNDQFLGNQTQLSSVNSNQQPRMHDFTPSP